jgi:hypothetical protein
VYREGDREELLEGLLMVASFLEQVFEFVQLAELYYAGSHGMDIMGPAKSSDGFRVKGTKTRDKKVSIVDILASAFNFVSPYN